VYKIRSDYSCVSINPYNRDYTVVPTILVESPKGSSDGKCLGPMKPYVRIIRVSQLTVQPLHLH
jgi:hypothetical protein